MRLFICFLLTCFSFTIPASAEKTFKSFTGKVLGNRVRLRTGPDLDSHIIRQVNKNDLLLIMGDENEFWAVKPPSGTKAYVYRTYILDGKVEANRVNIRLEPHIDAPIVGQLEIGAKIAGTLSQINSKWYEISPPENMRFYVSKEYVTFAGGPDYISQMEVKRNEGSEVLSSAFTLLNEQAKKSFEEMNPDQTIAKFESVIKNYSEFDDFIKQAKEGLAILKDNYTKKKIAYLENKANNTKAIEEVVFPKYIEDSGKILTGNSSRKNTTAKMRLWEEVEEGLYLTWRTFNTSKGFDDFYHEQKVNANVLTGVLESYDHMVKNKPGDYVLKKNDNPIAFIYSTQVNLEDFVGQEIHLLVSPRPNNHFAFPAYFALAVE